MSHYADYSDIASKETAMDRLLSVNEAGALLGGISKYTIHSWLGSGKLRRTKVGRRTMIRESELQRVIEEGGKSSAPKRRKVDNGPLGHTVPAHRRNGR
jgi:excisionase family DNA binding protein